jgi:hypothetical protein
MGFYDLSVAASPHFFCFYRNGQRYALTNNGVRIADNSKDKPSIVCGFMHDDNHTFKNNFGRRAGPRAGRKIDPLHLLSGSLAPRRSLATGPACGGGFPADTSGTPGRGPLQFRTPCCLCFALVLSDLRHVIFSLFLTALLCLPIFESPLLDRKE